MMHKKKVCLKDIHLSLSQKKKERKKDIHLLLGKK